MAQAFSLSSAVRVFPCPNCKETINTSMQQCPFCSSPIDHEAAEQSAAATSRISQACSDSSYLKIMAWTLVGFFLLMFVPFFNFFGFLGTWFLRIAILFMLIRWWVKFGSIKTNDPDFASAKQATIAVSIFAVVALASALYR